jgi:hypothetical protein
MMNVGRSRPKFPRFDHLNFRPIDHSTRWVPPVPWPGMGAGRTLHKVTKGATSPKQERKVAGHDNTIRSLVTAIRRLMESPPPTPRKRIGFRVEEGRPAYRLRRRRR